MGKRVCCMHRHKWKVELGRSAKSALAKARQSDSGSSRGQALVWSSGELRIKRRPSSAPPLRIIICYS
uniref:Uncharacterized protein n=1 Tax=Parascaris univalens TaxID=6257 RepID=A0A915BUQ8_PARUN